MIPIVVSVSYWLKISLSSRSLSMMWRKFRSRLSCQTFDSCKENHFYPWLPSSLARSSVNGRIVDRWTSSDETSWSNRCLYSDSAFFIQFNSFFNSSPPPNYLLNLSKLNSYNSINQLSFKQKLTLIQICFPIN